MATALRVAPISQGCSDATLVAAVRHGNDTAFEELYSRYSARIGAYVRGMVGDPGRAEDITQEIFIAALRRMRETERAIAFKPWIYEIAKNACIDSFRRTRRAQEVSLDADDSLSSADRGRLTIITTPDAALDSKQALYDLRGAFGGLSESHHEILVLRELEGRSYSDIGERLGMSRPVVESTLFRARRRLAEEYDELASGRRCEFVRKMVDSGPHYSLGIRDRRRMARHFAHCQSCRSHARVQGFDESILNMPSVAAKIAALLPIPLLRARLGAVEQLGTSRSRPSLLALRSVHTLAGSSDQIVGMSGAGRGAATAAAIVLAGVGGGIVTVTSPLGVKTPHRTVVRAVAHGAYAPVPARRTALGTSVGAQPPVGAGGTSRTSGHASHRGRFGPVAGPSGGASATGSGGPQTSVAPGATSTTTAPAASVSGPSAPGDAGAPTGVGSDVPVTTTGAGSESLPDQTYGAPTPAPAATPATPTVTTPTVTTPTTDTQAPGSTPSGAVSGTLSGVAGTVPQLPTGPGSAASGAVAGAINGVIGVLGGS